MLVTAAAVTGWARGKLGGADSVQLERCIAAAGAWLARETGRVLEQSAQVITLDGDAADGKYGEVLQLPRGWRPIVHATPDLVTVSENGTSLVVAAGYTTSADVVIAGANADAPCRLIRRPTAAAVALADAAPAAGWARGVQNISVAAPKVGFATGSVPSDLQQLAAEVAWLLYSEPERIGKAATAKAGHSVTLRDELSALAREILATWTVR